MEGFYKVYHMVGFVIFLEAMKAKGVELAITDEVMRLMKALKGAGHVVYVCGGWVRDALLKRVKTDPHMDMVTSATPDAIAKIVEPLGYKARFVGKVFGVTVVNEFEVATFRTERSYSDGRHPDAVEFGASPELDAQRRDFTINALFYDPFEKKVVDYVGGLEDIELKKLRFIGNPIDRLMEDRLRAIRYVRFIGALGENWRQESSVEAIKSFADNIVPMLAWERISEETFKMLEGPRPDVCMDMLKEVSLLKYILPELDGAFGVAGGGFHDETVYEHSLLCARRAREFLDNPPYPNKPLPRRGLFVLACLIHDLGKVRAAKQVAYCPKCKKRNVPTLEVDASLRCARCGTEVELDWAFYGHERLGAEIAEKIAERFKLSIKDKEYLVALTRNHMITIAPDKVLRKCNRCEAEFPSWSSVAFELLPADVQDDAKSCPECGSTNSEIIRMTKKGASLAPIRRLVVKLGKELAWDLVLLRWADTLANLKDEERKKLSGHLFAAMYDKVIEEMKQFKITDLAIDGNDLMALGLKQGPLIGEMLNHLKEKILDDPTRNNREWLMGEVKKYLATKTKEPNLKIDSEEGSG